MTGTTVMAKSDSMDSNFLNFNIDGDLLYLRLSNEPGTDHGASS
jgi:hypothetical protein